MSLQENIKILQENFLKDVPEPVVELIFQVTADLEATGISERTLKKGHHLPDFILPNANGTEISSKALRADGPLVINFYRGGWCPYCNLELKAFQDILPAIKAAGGQLIAISPNLPDKSLSSIEKFALEFEVLTDLHNKVAKQFGLVFTLDERLRPMYNKFGINIPEFNGDESFELPLPGTYVIDSSGLIHLAFIDADYAKRLEPEKVIQVLNSIS